MLKFSFLSASMCYKSIVSRMINTNPSFHVAAATDIAGRTPLT